MLLNFADGSQTRPLFYPVRQLHHVCRVDAEEDVQDFRPLRPGLDSTEIVVLLLCPERALHRSYPHSGKFLSDKVFLLFLLTERTTSFYERCLDPVRLAVVPVFSSRLVRISSDLFRFDPKQFLVYLQINFLSFFIILLGRKINIPVSHAFISFIFNTVWYISTTAFSITHLLLVSEPEI